MVDPMVTGLSYALLHSLWLLPLFAVISALALRGGRRGRALHRYRRVQAALALGVLLSAALGGAEAWQAMSAPPAAPVLTVDGLSAPAPSVPAWRFNASALAAIWAVGVFLYACRVMSGAYRVAGIRRRSRTASAERRAVIERLSRSAGLMRAPDLRFSDEVAGPFVCGVFRPALIMPAGLFDDLGAAQAELICRHELGHVRHRDVLALHVEIALRCVLFFNVGAFALLRQIARERERAADDFAATAPPDRRRLALALGRLAVGVGAGRSLSVAGAAFGDLPGRIRRLAGPTGAHGRATGHGSFRLQRGALLAVPLALGAAAAFTASPVDTRRAAPADASGSMTDIERMFDAAELVFDDAERVFDRAEAAFDRGETARAERLHDEAETIHARAEKLHDLTIAAREPDANRD